MDERKKILDYQKRREKRLKDRGLVLYKNRFDFFRSDADGDDDNNNQNNKGGGESHGNTRLPFGLCKRFGIEIGKDWTPKDAWDALKGKGVTPEGAYDRLEKGEDPGSPEATATPETKPAKKTITRTIDGETKEWEVGDTAKETVVPFSGKKPYTMKLKREGEDQEMYFGSKEAMMKFLKEEGVTEVADPDTGEVVDPTKMEFPERAVTWKGKGMYAAEYGPFKIDYWGWRSDPWKVEARMIDGTKEGTGYVTSYISMRYKTKEDMLYALKDMGIEEIDDPQTGETINPKEMELPDRIFSYRGRGYSKLSIGLRDGRYTIIGEGFDGKKEKLDDFRTLDAAKRWMKEQGADPEIAKLSPALKKREAERLSWLTSDKTEFYTDPSTGARYGDLTAERIYGGWKLVGEDEEGNKNVWKFGSKIQMLKALKEQGVEKVKIDKESINPKEYEVPKTVATIKGDDFQELHLVSAGGYLYLAGTDIDGISDSSIDWMRAGESVDEFFKRLKDSYGVDESAIGVNEGTKEWVAKRRKEDEEKERRRKEFESKAVSVGASRVVDPFVKKDDTGRIRLYGYDQNGNLTSVLNGRNWNRIVERAENLGVNLEQYIKDDALKKDYEEYKKQKAEFEQKAIDIDGEKYADLELFKDYDGTYQIRGINSDYEMGSATGWGDLYDMDEFAKSHGIDLESIIKDEGAKEEYQKYKKAREEFEQKAVDIGGGKYSGVEVSHDGGQYIISGYDKRGRKRTLSTAADWQGVQDNLQSFGYTKDSFPLTEEAKKRADRAEKAKELVATGEWYHVGGDRDQAYTDLSVMKANDKGDWCIVGKDIDGKEGKIGTNVSSWDEAIRAMENLGVKNYKVMENGKDIGKPKWGMHSVLLMRKPEGGYVIYADSKKYGKHAVMFEDPKEENARRWLTENGIPQGTVKTRGMNPNDDVKREHTAKSLENFDVHRMERAEKDPIISNMTDDEKKATADMLTEMFDKGAYRMRRSDPSHFASYVLDGFKNLLETGESSGSSYKPGRRETGEKTYGHKGLKPSETERYGYWGLEDDKEAIDDYTASGYGRMMFKFKKDRVGERTTYTFGDTLDAGRPVAGYAGKNPTIEGVSGIPGRFGTDDEGREKLKRIEKQYKKYKDGEISFADFYKYVSATCQDGYVECQLHGPLKIEDVESIIMPESHLRRAFRDMGEEKRKKVVEKLKGLGVKFQYVDNSDKARDAYDWIKQQYGE
jgi:hypothetical protein